MASKKKTPQFYALRDLKVGESNIIAATRIVPADVVAKWKQKHIDSLLKRGAIAKLPDSAQPRPVVKTDENTGVQTAQLAHLWNFEDDQMLDRPLEHLNIMVQDHVKKHELEPVQPFETRAEAIAFMTQDRDGGPLIVEDADEEPEDDKKEG